MTAVTWADAGNPKSKVTLADAQAWAVEYGFVKTDVPKDRPIAQRVDMVAFFNVYNATAFSAFRKKFKTRRLKPPNEPQDDETDDEGSDDDDYTDEEIATFLSEYEKHKDYEKLKWRYIKRPGGQAIRPDAYYACYGAARHLKDGDNTEPAPMWREDGSIDYGGRAKWDGWDACKGMTEERAKIAFAKAMRGALANPAENFY